jgi:DNA-binding GntR family transcriptional regulator
MMDAASMALSFQTKEEAVYHNLRIAILQLSLKPGEKLVIDRLSESLKVSTIPVRAALQRLQAEGLVEIVPHTGAIVSAISPQMIGEVFDILAVLEGLACGPAIEKATEEEIEQLHAIVEAMDQAVRQDDYDGWSDLNSQYHQKVTEISGMHLLMDFTNRAFDHWARIRRCYLRQVDPSRLALAQAEHHQMIDLFHKRQGKDLAELVARHNSEAREAYLKLVPIREGGTTIEEI